MDIEGISRFDSEGFGSIEKSKRFGRLDSEGFGRFESEQFGTLDSKRFGR